MKIIILLSSFFTLSFFSLASSYPGPKVKFETNFGSFTVVMFMKNAPRSTRNFLSYVKSGAYNNMKVHRLVDNYGIKIVQTGYLKSNGETIKTRDPIKNEATNLISNRRGTIAMARYSSPHSATSSFFINVKDNGAVLDYKDNSDQGYGFAVFGKVIRGMKVVDAISRARRRGPESDEPARRIIVHRAKIVR